MIERLRDEIAFGEVVIAAGRESLDALEARIRELRAKIAALDKEKDERLA